ncbi:methyltransferase family protein [Micromonospora sp. Llam0]|uniref:class I SAM-dependent methyltransferase n=1 Tax=Micromonospora sp. Llam0 TaxID=2485143 RepID=UPI000F4AE11B|nr:class I SAM-dependent methyltransferase [Micromonospora sp. Llam0]ROO52682.1 methyltransferase family protein [Micromonospora sp. Llam0]
MTIRKRLLENLERVTEAAVTQTFDRLLKKHPDEGVFWNNLFADKMRVFDETGKTDWDSPSSRSYYELLLEDFTRLSGTPSSALEMGCGTAVLSILLAAQGADATIVDRSAAALDYAKVLEQRLRREFTFVGTVSYVRADFLELDRTFCCELVHNCGVIEEIPIDSASEVVAAMAQHAERRVVVGVPNFFNPYLLGIWGRGGKGTERYYSARTLRRVLRAAGLRGARVSNSSCIHPLLPRTMNRGLGLGFLHLGVADV